MNLHNLRKKMEDCIKTQNKPLSAKQKYSNDMLGYLEQHWEDKKTFLLHSNHSVWCLYSSWCTRKLNAQLTR